MFLCCSKLHTYIFVVSPLVIFDYKAISCMLLVIVDKIAVALNYFPPWLSN